MNEFTNELLKFLTNFFGTPAILIGIFALLGCLLQHKKMGETVVSVFKTIIGFLIIGGGAALVGTSIGAFSGAFDLLFNRQGWIANNDVIPGILLMMDNMAWVASCGSLILVFGMLLNLVLARISGFKFVYLTGHSAWYFSTMLASIMVAAGLNNKIDMWQIVLCGSLLVSVWMVVQPQLLQKHMNIITSNQPISLAHTGGLGYFASGIVGDLVFKIKGAKVRSTESINFPKGLAFLRNTNVSIALTMLVLFSVVYFSCWGVRGSQAMIDAGIISSSDSVIVQGILMAFTFAAGVEVILIGVRMFIAELTPAFKGIAEKLIRGSRPAIDCPVVFPFAPNAVIIGFIASMIAGIICFGVSIGIASSLPTSSTWAVVVIPSIVPHFFTGATAGVFGNAKGGVWGCILGAFVNGIIISTVPYLFIGSGAYCWNTHVIWGDADFIVGFVPFLLIKYATRWSLLGFAFLIWLMLPLLHFISHNKKMKNDIYKNAYFQLNGLYKQKTIDYKALKETYKNNIRNINSQIKTSSKEQKQEFIVQKRTTTNEFNKQLRLINKNYDTKLEPVWLTLNNFGKIHKAD
ncbi:MAG: PTS ascorbate transporter subunit IIC [Mycoplasmataceae bacterium]|nr:PTS ascorbate transporter subunit IIC [Mycoplasmataceae bacterium]